MSLEERDQCEISAAKIDVTQKIADAARSAMEKALVTLDEKLSRVSVAKPIGNIWLTLQRPISICQRNPLAADPAASRLLRRDHRDDSSLTARLALLAQPRMLSGPRPPDGTNPLPHLGRGVEGGDTAMVSMDAVLVYPAATKLIGKALVGKNSGPSGGRSRSRR